MARLLYRDNEVIYQPCDPHSQAEDNSHDGSPPPSCKDPQEKDTSVESEHTHPILIQESPNAAPVTHLLPEASDLFSDSLPPTHNHQSACMDNCASTAKSTLSVCPTTPLIATDQTSSENTPSSSNSPTQLVLTTFDEHDDSDLKTTLAASISRLVKGDENLLKEFDELRSTLKEAKKTRDRPKNMKDKVERYKVLSAKISLQVLAKRTQLDDAVKKYEHQYFLKHGQLPKSDPSYTDLIKERNPVLRTLNISL